MCVPTHATAVEHSDWQDDDHVSCNSMITCTLQCAHASCHLPMGRLIRQAEQTGPWTHSLRLARNRIQPTGAISSPWPTPVPSFRWFLRLARAQSRPPTIPRISQTTTPPNYGAPPNCGTRQGTIRLTPREDCRLDQAGALILINVAGNLDIIPCQDTDAPRKQTLTYTQRCYNNYDMGSLSLGGSGVQTTPRSLPRLSTGNQQAQLNSTVHRHVGLQTKGHLSFEYNT
jgi:hypothetical protein